MPHQLFIAVSVHCMYKRKGTLKVTKDNVATHNTSVDSTSYFRLFTIRSYAAVTLHPAWEYMNFQQLPAWHHLRNPTTTRLFETPFGTNEAANHPDSKRNPTTTANGLKHALARNSTRQGARAGSQGKGAESECCQPSRDSRIGCKGRDKRDGPPSYSASSPRRCWSAVSCSAPLPLPSLLATSLCDSLRLGQAEPPQWGTGLGTEGTVAFASELLGSKAQNKCLLSYSWAFFASFTSFSWARA